MSGQSAMRPTAPKHRCGNEAVHGPHEWLMLGAFRTQCPGYVGAVATVEPEVLRFALVDEQGRCGCCYATGEHRCGHECYSCDSSGKDPDSPVCPVPHGPICQCPPRTAEQPEEKP